MMKANSIAKKVFIVILFFVSLVSVFYYSWLPDPSLKTESYLPECILNWSNQYFNLRTAVPFLVIGYSTELWTSVSLQSHLKKHSPFRLEIIGIAILIVSVAEGGQFFIAKRHPDFIDISFGIAGSIFGSLGYHLIQIINSLFINKNAK